MKRNPIADVAQHQRDWTKLTAWVALVAACVGFWLGLLFALGVIR